MEINKIIVNDIDPDKKIKVAAYCRVSTDHSDLLESLDAQRSHYESCSSTSVRGIIGNERYTGDAVFQKPYTDSSFKRHRNKGEVDQYFAQNHHEDIVSHETFEKANAVISQRASEKGILTGDEKYHTRYAFSGKIICGECGDEFYPRIIDKAVFNKANEIIM